jgi:hypothetical protein
MRHLLEEKSKRKNERKKRLAEKIDGAIVAVFEKF